MRWAYWPLIYAVKQHIDFCLVRVTAEHQGRQRPTTISPWLKGCFVGNLLIPRIARLREKTDVMGNCLVAEDEPTGTERRAGPGESE
eukprot:2297016-Rhodomonas_salina.2